MTNKIRIILLLTSRKHVLVSHFTSMIKHISAKQKKVLDYYTNFIRTNQASPTYQQAAADLDISPSVVYSHIKNLEKT